jgi:Flp pilus assembly protein TadG
VVAVLKGVSSQRSRGHQGQSLVEFALVAPLIALLLLGAIDLTRAFYYYIILENSTREAARVLIDFPYQFDDTEACRAAVREAQSYVSLSCSGGTPTVTISPSASLATTPPRRVPGRNPVTVTATTTFTPMTPLIQNFTGGTITLRASTTMMTWY